MAGKAYHATSNKCAKQGHALSGTDAVLQLLSCLPTNEMSHTMKESDTEMTLGCRLPPTSTWFTSVMVFWGARKGGRLFKKSGKECTHEARGGTSASGEATHGTACERGGKRTSGQGAYGWPGCVQLPLRLLHAAVQHTHPLDGRIGWRAVRVRQACQRQVLAQDGLRGGAQLGHLAAGRSAVECRAWVVGFGSLGSGALACPGCL